MRRRRRRDVQEVGRCTTHDAAAEAEATIWRWTAWCWTLDLDRGTEPKAVLGQGGANGQNGGKKVFPEQLFRSSDPAL